MMGTQVQAIEKALCGSAIAQPDEVRTQHLNGEAAAGAIAGLRILLETSDGDAEESFHSPQDAVAGDGGKTYLQDLNVAVKSFCAGPLVILLCIQGNAQTVQMLPEIDTNVKLSSDLRVSFQAKDTREGGAPEQAEIGPSLDFYLKPLIRLQEATKFDLDDAKPRPLVFSVGYRYMPQANNAAAINRMEPVVVFHFPLQARFLLSDKNRADLNWQNGSFSWRYRNRVEIEKTLTLGSYHPAPYASVEFFYQSQYGKWSDTAVYAGCSLPIGKHLEFKPYYEHQNNTGKSPNKQLNRLGLILNLYFSVR
jgi:hypothetical protein